ncbi:hypothetical protein [Salegentibacter sp. UBA1130]|jgi:hypothetical protein|nr:hypothetical protein [Salegentibacter sp. UBA1130]|tara:strand:+ start:155 stop:295 length:141 start_codon:yes stop_codon:yes gene_type:complete
MTKITTTNINLKRKKLELEFETSTRVREDSILLNQVYDETILPEWE